MTQEDTQLVARKASTPATSYVDGHGNPMKLTLDSIRELFNVPDATDAEVALFIRVCEGQKLNPFLRELYLIKYDAKSAASIVTGKDTFTQRAETHPHYDGFSAGTIVNRKGVLVEEIGSFVAPGDVLVGGWFEGRRKDWSKPFKHRCMLSEFNKGQSTWRQMAATMIRKVAIVQGLRDMFPKLFVGLYDPAEMRDVAVTSDGVPVEVNQPNVIGTVEPNDAYIEVIDLGKCPVHDVEWRESRGPQGTFMSHKMDDGGYCNPGRAIKLYALSSLNLTQEEVNVHCNEKFGVPSSKLTPEQCTEMFEFYKQQVQE